MKLGRSGSSRRGQFLVLALALSLSIPELLSAQQPANASGAGENNSPVPSAAQPVSQTPASAPSAQDVAKQPSDGAKDTGSLPSVKLGPGDLLEVTVYNVPELGTKARVGNSGDVYLPLVDYVHVEGLTQEEAQTLIEKRLEDGGFVRNPHVTIFVDDAASQGVTVLGEVAKPGIYPDTADHKLYQIISQAGGFTASASRKIAILRKDQPEPIHIELPRNLADNTSGNVDVLPGDTITVPRAPIIYVVGDVGHPSGFLVDNGTLTVLQALALAGGTNRTAKLGASRIIRKGPNGMVEEKVEIKKMLEAKSPDVQLHADDILFIPVSGGKVFAGKTFDAAISAATMVTVYSVHP
ncbi:MAG TPA: polysaccharide biosynthesis/export family protein [Candidatus Acidoferrales bacterium]|nr:polysaccharide biosynthesis/export family protein [Candidatus Acidoferrales bacterium]